MNLEDRIFVGWLIYMGLFFTWISIYAFGVPIAIWIGTICLEIGLISVFINNEMKES